MNLVSHGLTPQSGISKKAGAQWGALRAQTSDKNEGLELFVIAVKEDLRGAPIA